MNLSIPHYPGITLDTHLGQTTFFPLCSFYYFPLTIALELEG